MERLNFETLFRIVRWDYNRCFKDESLDKNLFMEKYGKVMGEHYYNKFVHEFNGNIMKMIGYFRGSEKEGQVFCDMITERIEKYEQRESYNDTPDNFWQIRWLDKYMEGHKGFIAGGCFKNILSGERVKDIDIFFESESDFQEAVDLFNDEKHQKEGWKFKYRNKKVCAFQKEGEKVWVEFIESEFGKPKEILRSFDFTVAKMAYYKEPKYEEKEDDYFPFSSASIVAYEYKLLYHEKFFEHLHMKRLVIDENIPFPVSTWERSYRYKGYGYNMCRETKKKLLQALKGVNVEEEDISLYTTGGWD